MVKITTKDILEVLHKMHPAPQWSFFPELRAGTGFAKKSQKRIDAWTINTYPSSKHHKISYEIKTVRSDFLKEIATPKKREVALLLSNQYYFVTPPGIIKETEIPEECGYIEVSWNVNNELVSKVIKEAPLRTVKTPTWTFLSAITRRTIKNEGIDFTGFSDDVLESIAAILKYGINLTGQEQLFFTLIHKERLRRNYKSRRQQIKEQKEFEKYLKNNPNLPTIDIISKWFKK